MLEVKRFFLNVVKSNYFPFLVLFLLLIVFHSTMHLSFGDDLFFSKVLDENNLFDYLISRYQTWSSRLINEFFLITIGRYPILWGFLDSVIITFGAYIISYLFSNRSYLSNIVICALILCLPIYLYCSAGFIATTIGYFWIGFIGMYSFVGIKKICAKQKIRPYEYVFYFLAILFASCHEQMCAIMTVTFAVFLVFNIIKTKKVNWYLLTALLINIASIIFILTCPGNFIRLEEETQRWFPAFENLNLLTKINIGFDYTMYEFVLRPTIIFMLLLIGITFLLFYQHKNISIRLLSFLPILVVLFFAFFINLICKNNESLTEVRNTIMSYGVGLEYDSNLAFIPTLVYMVVLVILFVSLMFVCSTTKERLLVSFIFALGFGSRMMMSFSPTNWASSTRTFFFMYISLIAILLMMWQKIEISKYKIPAITLIGVCSLASYIWMVGYASGLVSFN